MGLEQDDSTVLIPQQINDLLGQMQTPVTYNVKKSTDSVPFLLRIPFLSRFVQSVGDVGGKAVRVGSSFIALPNVNPSVELSSGFHWSGFALAAVDFLVIPMIYLSSYIYGEKVPFTLSNNARWLYSGVVVGLALTSLLVPAAAPAIGIVLGGISLGLSVFLLSKAVYERYQLGKERREIRNELAPAEEEMRHIQEQARVLQIAFATAANAEEQKNIGFQIVLLKEHYDEQKLKITALKEKEAVYNEKIEKLGFIHILDKGVAVGLSSVAMAGLVVSLFLPTVGLPMLAGVATASLAYLSARIVVPLIRDAGIWVFNKLRHAFGSHETEHSEHTPKMHAEFNSTASMLEQFLGHEEGVAACAKHVHTQHTANPCSDVSTFPQMVSHGLQNDAVEVGVQPEKEASAEEGDVKAISM